VWGGGRLSTEELIRELRGLFQCRQTVYALGQPRKDGSGKFEYFPARDPQGNDLPLTDEILKEHLKGNQMVGIYPLIPGDLVGWVAIDFDKGEDPVADAFRQVDKFRSLGFVSHVERSRSGTGAHVWIFFDSLLPASKVRRVVIPNLIDATSYDMLFPNQDSAGDKYGNLIALPYNGKAYKDNQSGFLSSSGQLLNPRDFLSEVKKNRSYIIEKLYSELPAELRQSARVRASLPVVQPIPGALKVESFCSWVKQAKERMPKQNQEPELYSLACQFCKLESGERLLNEIGALHPYSPDRIQGKWERACRENKPELCVTLREKYGDCGKRCDQELEGVSHPYDLARVPFNQLQTTSSKPHPEAFQDVAFRVVERAKRIYKHQEQPGWPWGWDLVDDLTELRRGDLIIIASRPSIGKSAIIPDVVVNLAELTEPVPSYCATLEMTREQLTQRVIARKAGVDSTSLDLGLLDYREWKRVIKASREPIPFYIDDSARSLEQILDTLGELTHQHGKGVAFIDFLQLIKREGREVERDVLDRTAVGLQAVAKLLDIPIIGMSQMNRLAEQEQQEGSTDPLDSWLRGSDALATAPDVIMFLTGKRGGQSIVNRTLRIHKERHRGCAGTEIEMTFDSSCFRFTPNRVKGFNQNLPRERPNLNDPMDLL
jgi:replicative DNA helicase